MGLLATTVGVLVTIVGLLAGLAALHDWLRRQSPDLRWTSTGTSLQNIGKGTAEEISLAITTRLVQISKPYEVKESWPDPIPVTIPHLQPNEAIDVLDVQRAATKFVTGLEVLYREKFGSATVNLVQQVDARCRGVGPVRYRRRFQIEVTVHVDVGWRPDGIAVIAPVGAVSAKLKQMESARRYVSWR